MFRLNRTLNNHGFLWVIAQTVVVIVGTGVDGFLGILVLRCLLLI